MRSTFRALLSTVTIILSIAELSVASAMDAQCLSFYKEERKPRAIVLEIPTAKSISKVKFNNPRITPLTNETGYSFERCGNSIFGCTVIPRYKHVRIDHTDEKGNPQVYEARYGVAYAVQKALADLDNGHLITGRSKPKMRQLIVDDYTPRHLKTIATIIEKQIEDSFRPFSLGYDLRKESGEENDFNRRMESLSKIFLLSKDTSERGKKLEEWVTSEADALFLYDLISQAGLNHFQSELNHLLENNVFFVESLRSGGGLVTYSFEKEGTTEDISYLYRPAEIQERDWMQMDDQERFERLKNAKVASKQFIPEIQIMPTDLKPLAVGGYSKEVSDHRRKGYGWEISHKRYEINQQRLMRQVRELAQIFRQTHSFQVHVSFELPKTYEHYENFIYWYKHLNDYLYLRGLEEGLHGNYLTGVANLKSDLTFQERTRDFIPRLYTGNTVQESQEKLNRRNSKFFSAGLRAGIYGPASAADQMKLGIELRDATRDMDVLDEYSASVGKSVSKRIWEGGDLSAIKSLGVRLNNDRTLARKKLSSIVSPEYAKIFSEAEATVTMALLPYEIQPIYDYKNKVFVTVPPHIMTRIKEARELYIKDLVELEIELKGLKAKGEKTETEIIQIALRMSLATWAKKARVAELFKNY